MKHVILLFALAFLSGPVWCKFFQENGVLVLDPYNFERAVHSFPYLMVEFYAPWCPYCQEFAPKYELAAKRLAEKGSSVVLAKLDAALFADFAAQLRVEEYPTMYFYQQGHPMFYNGELETVPLVQWVQSNSRRESTTQTAEVFDLDLQNFDYAVQNYPILLVEFYAPWCPHCQEFAPRYLKAAQAMARINPNVKFAKIDATKETQLAEEHDIQRYPTLKLFRYGVPTIYDGPRDEVSLVNWLVGNV
ncbi:AAEL017390-PA [Aedes aegypti]|uniref:AAEL017390-PA n=1 Tax=Aedes aegypti TaxID=7159 RepID=J9HTA9_AEDAE|nr:AAEL017390-PA [Aedes aegypti]